MSKVSATLSVNRSTTSDTRPNFIFSILSILSLLSFPLPIVSHSSSREKVETLLAHGATRAEACRPVATEALRLALLPVINQMSVIGLISIPGMMVSAWQQRRL